MGILDSVTGRVGEFIRDMQVGGQRSAQSTRTPEDILTRFRATDTAAQHAWEQITKTIEETRRVAAVAEHHATQAGAKSPVEAAQYNAQAKKLKDEVARLTATIDTSYHREFLTQWDAQLHNPPAAGAASNNTTPRIDLTTLDAVITSTTSDATKKCLEELKKNIVSLNEALKKLDALEKRTDHLRTPEGQKECRDIMREINEQMTIINGQLHDPAARTLIQNAMKGKQAEYLVLLNRLYALSILTGATPTNVLGLDSQISAEALDNEEYSFSETTYKKDGYGAYTYNLLTPNSTTSPLLCSDKKTPLKLSETALLQCIAAFNKERHEQWVTGGSWGRPPIDVTCTRGANGRIQTIHCRDHNGSNHAAVKQHFIDDKMRPAGDAALAKKQAKSSVTVTHTTLAAASGTAATASAQNTPRRPY